jgi:hypothetical protein
MAGRAVAFIRSIVDMDRVYACLFVFQKKRRNEDGFDMLIWVLLSAKQDAVEDLVKPGILWVKESVKRYGRCMRKRRNQTEDPEKQFDVKSILLLIGTSLDWIPKHNLIQLGEALP